MKKEIREQIELVLSELGFSGIDFAIDFPTDKNTDADYFSNVAMVAAKQAGEAPRQFAEKIVTALEGRISQIEKIEIAGPGFINFYLQREFFREKILNVLDAKENWGKNNSWSNKLVIVEYTDPNPFKELHIGHLVPNALGESLARLFMMAGANTKRVTFQGDVGMHVAKALYGARQIDVQSESITSEQLGKAYAAGSRAFESSEEVAAEIKGLNKVIYNRSDEKLNTLYDAGKKVSLDYFEEIYAVLGSDFDHNFFESVTGPVGLELVQKNIGEVFKESRGAVIFEGEKYGLHTRVFVNNEGLPTYETKDVGLIQCKENWSQETVGKSFDHAITVTGTEQLEYFKVTTKASELIQPDLAGKVELVANGMLRLAEGKMSSRTGDVVRALALITDVKEAALERMKENNVIDSETVAEQIAVAAIKYSILQIAAGKDIVFDLKKSISFEGDSGPYLQYTHARICSVLEKAKSAGVELSVENIPAESYAVEKLVQQWPEVVEVSLKERAPHKVVHYLTELAGEFNSFYAAEKIADEDDEYAPYKAAVSDAVRITLERGLWVLGIEAPERM